MKTIFITIFQGVEAKNILRTNVYPELIKREDVRIIFFVRTEERAEYYRKEFSHPRVLYEAATYRQHHWLDRLFGLLKFHLIRTATTDMRRRMDRELTGDYLTYFGGIILNRVLARPFFRRIIRWVDERFVTNESFTRFFDAYQPDLVFLAHLFDDGEIALLREAKRRKVKTIGFVNSWDKLTARSAMRILPDHLLVYNELVRNEAITQADMPKHAIAVVGIPQYDRYAGFTLSPREQFMQKVGLDPKKKFFLYAPMGEAFSTSDWDIIDLLHSWVETSRLGEVDFLVRFQPNDAIREEEIAKRPWLHYERPGIRFSRERGVDWDMKADELEHLANTLYHMSLLVCYASSMSVDAAIFDKPVINIGFEIKPAEALIKSPTQFYQMTHYQNAIETGGIRMVKTPNDLLNWIKEYLEAPETDRTGRERLVKEQCHFTDGKAGERTARTITDTLG